MTKVTSKFAIGDVVKVVDNGRHYRAYKDLMNEDFSTYKDEWVFAGNGPDNDSILDVVAYAPHHDDPEEMVVLVRDNKRKRVWMIEQQGLQLVSHLMEQRTYVVTVRSRHVNGKEPRKTIVSLAQRNEILKRLEERKIRYSGYSKHTKRHCTNVGNVNYPKITFEDLYGEKHTVHVHRLHWELVVGRALHTGMVLVREPWASETSLEIADWRETTYHQMVRQARNVGTHISVSGKANNVRLPDIVVQYIRQQGFYGRYTMKDYKYLLLKSPRQISNIINGYAYKNVETPKGRVNRFDFLWELQCYRNACLEFCPMNVVLNGTRGN